MLFQAQNQKHYISDPMKDIFKFSYVIVMFFVWTPCTVNRVVEAATGTSYLVLGYWQSLFLPLWGYLYCVLNI